MNPTNNNLQKAIDDITKSNGSPFFSDPVAAPSTIPDDDTGSLDPIGPFPNTPSPEPNFPQNNSFSHSSPLAQNFPDAPSNIQSNNNLDSKPLETTAAYPKTEVTSEPEPELAPTSIDTLASNTLTPKTPTENSGNQNQAPTSSSSYSKIRESALRDIIPLLDHINDLDSTKKFLIYRDIIDVLHDTSVIEMAYQVASEIPDDTERGKALLYLIESIDKIDQAANLS